MNKLLTTLTIIFAAAFSAHADWVIVQNSNTEGQTKEITLKIKGDLARVDMGGAMSALLGADGITMLMHQQKMMMRMDKERLKKTMEMAAKLGVVRNGKAATKPTATGRKEKVGEWEAEIYTWEGDGGKGTFWVAKDFPKAAEINAVSDKMSKVMGSPMSSMAPRAVDFPGMVVKSEMTMMGRTIVTTLVSATEQEVDAKEFTAPEGYHEMQMPMLPGGAPK